MTSISQSIGVAGPSSSLARGVFQMATGRGATIAIAMLTAPILGRLFPPASYGALTVISTLCGFLAAFATLTYVQALPLAANAVERRALFVLCLVIMTAMVFGVAVGSALGGRRLAAAFREPQVAHYVWFLPPMFLAAGIKELLDTSLSCERRFTTVSIRAVLEAAVTRVTQIGLCFVGLKGAPLGLFFGSLAGTWTAALASGRGVALRMIRGAPGMVRFGEIREAAIKHRKFPLISLWNQTLNTVTLGLPQILLGLRFNLESVAFYNMGLMMIGLPLNLFATSSSQVFYVEIADLSARGRSTAPAAQQLVRLLSALVAFPLTVVLLLGPMLFEVFLGNRWREAGVYSQILMPWMAFMAYSSPLSSVFLLLSRQGEMLGYNLILLGARFGVLYFGGIYLNVRHTLALFMVVGFIISAWLAFRTVHLLGVSLLWMCRQVFLSYIIPTAILLPAAVLYWHFDFTAGSLVALAGACAAQLVFLHRRFPQVLRRFASHVLPQ